MKVRVVLSFVAALVVVAFVASAAVAQGPWSQFDGILADQVVATVSVTSPDVIVSDDLTVTDSVTAYSLTSTGNVAGVTAAFSSNATVGGTLGVTGGLAAATLFNTVPQAELTVTGSGVITPTGTLQMITAASPVTSGNIASGSPGQMLVLVNVGANAITIPDSGDQYLAGGNVVLGQWDTLTLVYYGTKWIQLATANN